MTSEATVRTTEDDVLAVSGELDAESCRPVRGVLWEAMTVRAGRGGGGPFVVDLSGVSFAASAALSLLLELEAHAGARSFPVVFVAPPGTFLERLLDRTGLSQTLTVAPSVETARAPRGSHARAPDAGGRQDG